MQKQVRFSLQGMYIEWAIVCLHAETLYATALANQAPDSANHVLGISVGPSKPLARKRRGSHLFADLWCGC